MTLNAMVELLSNAPRRERTKTSTKIKELPSTCRLVLLSFVGATAALLLMIVPTPSSATSRNVCDHAARQAAIETSVPLPVLLSITRTETGRSEAGQLQPWPWTVNMEGVGQWFESADTAQAYVFKHIKRGARSFDIGCFQINYKWHGAAFQSIEQMFDPLENARYAALFLLRLYRETGDWSVAAGAYHSRTPEYATRYRAKFDQILQRHQNTPGASRLKARRSVSHSQSETATSKANNYPLLKQINGKRSFGSLVPILNGQTRPVFQRTNNLGGS